MVCNHLFQPAHNREGMSDLLQPYGPKVALEEEMILRVIQKAAAARGIALLEGDLDSFFRQRREKIEQHSRQEADEDFERVRLLNMLFEGLIDFIKRAAAASSSDVSNARYLA